MEKYDANGSNKADVNSSHPVVDSEDPLLADRKIIRMSMLVKISKKGKDNDTWTLLD